MGEDMVEVIQKILTVEVYQKIHTEDTADIKRIRTGDMAEIKLIRTEDMEAVIKNNITEDMVADTRLVHMVTAIPTDTKNITEPSTITSKNTDGAAQLPSALCTPDTDMDTIIRSNTDTVITIHTDTGQSLTVTRSLMVMVKSPTVTNPNTEKKPMNE